MKTQKSRSGFTLIELMVVAIIVAVLAAVAIPMMTANKKRAASTEGESGLGSIRTALRAMYAETQAYNVNYNGGAISAGAVSPAIPGIGTNDLTGKYFNTSDYTITAIGANTYTLTVTGTKPDVAGVTITLNELGNWTRVGL